MKRIAAILLLLLGLGIAAATKTHAQTETVVVAGHVCYVVPSYRLVPCPATPFPTAVPIAPLKTLDVSGGQIVGDDVAQYFVTITSRLACFPLTEPIDVYTAGNIGEAVLSPATPGSFPLQKPDVYQVTVNPTTDQAVLSLEVWNKAIGPGGLAVKAVWPLEQLERVVPVYPPASPLPTATGQPAAPTDTPTATPVGTPMAAAAPTIPASQFFLRTCVTPNPTNGATTATVYFQTLPGSECSAVVAFNDATNAPELNGVTVSVGDTGTGGFNFNVDQNATEGIATVTCTYQGVTASSSANFSIGTATATPVPTP